MNTASKVLFSQRLMQTCIFIISLVCLYIGSIRIFIGAKESSLIDNSIRFYAGGFIAIGVLAMWVAITIKKQNELIYFLSFFVFMAGIGRFVSINIVGLPSNVHLLYLSLEFLLPLILIVNLIYLKKCLK